MNDILNPNSKRIWQEKEKKQLVVRGMSYLGVGHFSKE
jgi:hypothetical protein